MQTSKQATNPTNKQTYIHTYTPTYVYKCISVLVIVHVVFEVGLIFICSVINFWFVCNYIHRIQVADTSGGIYLKFLVQEEIQ